MRSLKFTISNKTYNPYELSNHLGNVLTTITSKPILVYDSEVFEYKSAEISSVNDYYPGGFPMPNRIYNSLSYRYGHNSQETDPEITGNWGTHYTAEFWMYDSRIQWRWNIDPVLKPWESPYYTFGGNPILNVDYKGDDWVAKTKRKQEKTETMIQKTFGTTEGVSWSKNGILNIDEDKFLAKTGTLSDDQKLAYDAFVTNIVKNSDIRITLKTNLFSSTHARWTNTESYAEAISSGKIAKGIINLNPFGGFNVSDDSEMSQFSYGNSKNINLDKATQHSVMTWHEAGHFYNDMQGYSFNNANLNIIDKNFQKTIDFENIFRRINNIPERLGNTHGYIDPNTWLNRGSGVYTQPIKLNRWDLPKGI